ncbi:MAG: hypothetical protein M3P04_03785, partial [Actinomycetota bacterium]|nr:hypothetical protein [Actinomycetota bacterium]
VLDTFEHVLAAAPAVGSLIDRAPWLRILVTSRAPLRLRGERELPLRSLDVHAAAELFVQRVRAVRPDLKLGPDPVVGEICGRLDGLPLALELAAARSRHLSLPALRDALSQPLQVLTQGDRDLPERQRTIRATIAWSYELLLPEDQAVFARLAVFSGGWTLLAAEHLAPHGQAVLDALGRLCEHGLVHADESAPVARWHLLDPVRDFAAELLQGATDVFRWHAEFFAELAETSAPFLLGPDQDWWSSRLREDAGNFRAAFAWAIDNDEHEVALKLAGSLWMFWRTEGAFAEARSWLDAALRAEGAEDSPHRRTALWGAGWLAHQQGDHEAASAFAQLLLVSAAEPLDRRNALTILGRVAMAENRYADSLLPFEEALTIARTQQSAWHLATSLLNLGTAVLHHGDAERARALLEEATAAHATSGDRRFLARARVELGYVCLLQADADAAGSHLGEALRTFAELGEQWGCAEALAGFAALAAVRGDPGTSARLLGASQSACEAISTQVIAPVAALGEPYLRKARAALGDAGWAEELAEGHQLTMDAAVSLARTQQPR